MRTNEPDTHCPCNGGRQLGRCGCALDQLANRAPAAQSWRWDGTPAMDAYCMVDRAAVVAALDAQPDVTGEAGSWFRFEPIPGGYQASATLTATVDDLLIVRTPSQTMADRIYGWLARICGAALLVEDDVVVRIGSVGEATPRQEDPIH